MKKYTTEQFIEKSKTIHGNKYDYSTVSYIHSQSKITIICREHGVFKQTPCSHLGGYGCNKCRYMYNTTESFIKKAIEVHGCKYKYNKSVYTTYDTKIVIICSKHGEFEQTPNGHLNGHGCKLCAIELVTINTTKSNESFIEEARLKHNNKYNYIKTNYLNWKTKVIIICPIHREFKQIPSAHLHGTGCLQCSRDNNKSNIQDFIRKAKELHGNRYNYDKVDYITGTSKVTIVCDTHGEFNQVPYAHLRGQGCRKCKMTAGESCILNHLKTKNINYFYQYSFDNLSDKRVLRFDFYLPEYNNSKYKGLCIEFDGIQHFEYIEHFHRTLKGFDGVKENDKIKDKYCQDKNIKLIRIPYWEKDNVTEILNKELEI